MANIAQTPIFSWKDIDSSSDLDRLRLVLLALPDEPVVAALEKRRGRGRDDYPVRATWNALLAGIVFQHKSIASLRRELMRNGELRALCGFDIHLGAAAVPSDYAFSRFLKLLSGRQELLGQMFHQLVERLGEQLPELGGKLAVDAKAIPSFGRPVTDEAKQHQPDRRRDLDADWGTKSYKGQRKDGSQWEKTKRWFGYKLHLLVDSHYELPLGFKITQASAGDTTWLLPLVDDLADRHPDLKKRAQELSADRAYDSAENKAALWDHHDIKPLIDHRLLWKEDAGQPRLLFDDRADVFLYDEMGKLYCQGPSEKRGEDELRELYFCGFERERQTLKYRCPAAAWDSHCPGRKQCEANVNVGDYGRVVRVPLNKNRRIFTPIARPSPKWKKAYNRRSAVERVNSRIDLVLGFEHHTIRGQKKMTVRMTLALAVMLAMALGRIHVGQKKKLRSITEPVKRAA